jgi:threonine synthase
MKLYNLKDHNEQVSFAQAVTQGWAKIRGCSSRMTCRNFS